VNDLTGQITVVETAREPGAVFLDLVRHARKANRRKDEILRASVSLTENMIVLHWHCESTSERGVELNAEILALSDPIHQVDAIIWGRRSDPTSGKGAAGGTP
jgi:hypothetical protein